MQRSVPELHVPARCFAGSGWLRMSRFTQVGSRGLLSP
jgi:hypothetical protein